MYRKCTRMGTLNKKVVSLLDNAINKAMSLGQKIIYVNELLVRYTSKYARDLRDSRLKR